MRAWSTTSVALALFFAALAGADLSDSENLAELRMEISRLKQDNNDLLAKLGNSEKRAEEASSSLTSLLEQMSKGETSAGAQGKVFGEVQKRTQQEIGRMSQMLSKAHEENRESKFRIRQLEEEMVQARKAMRDCMNRHAPHMKGREFSPFDMDRIRDQQLHRSRLGKDEM